MKEEEKFLNVKLTKREIEILVETFKNNTIFNYYKNVPDKFLIEDIRIHNKLLRIISESEYYYRKNKLTLAKVRNNLKYEK